MSQYNINDEEDPIFRSSPAARFNIIDVQSVKNLPKTLNELKKTSSPVEPAAVLVNFKPESIVINGVKGLDGKDGKDGKDGRDGRSVKGEKGEKGDKGDKGDRGENGKDGKDGKDSTAKGEKGDKGEKGERGEKGEMGEDGKDGIDGVANPEEVAYLSGKKVDEHEKKFDHSLLTKPTTIGTRVVDESEIGDGKILTYNAKTNKLGYVYPPKIKRPLIGGGGITLPQRTGNEGKYLQVDTDKGLKWATISSVKSVTADATAGTENVILCNAASGAITISLPAASSSTDVTYSIKKIDTSDNAVTINANLSETIDGELTQTLSVPYSTFTIVCDGTSWYIL